MTSPISPTPAAADGAAQQPFDRHPGPPVRVDVWSDVACPWCYIGKRRLETAIAAFDGEVSVEYHAFELSPDTPEDYAGSTTEYLSQRKGMPADTVEEMLAHVTRLAADEGLAYDFDAVKHRRTLKAHQLVAFAKARGRQAEVKERLLQAYFEQGRDVADMDVLAEVGAEAGLDPAQVREALESDALLQDVVADIEQARRLGIQGVPFFVVDQKYGISGAQTPETFAQVFDQVLAERAEVAS
ncbi:DsbA family protein [Cellulomonas sp. PhB143]|uniref:DsbA family oxidoreductase n=1 Tax=Cellulomonas sp. PhB143 TaxID=2485186 RepID=UPI000FA0FF1A|nr:DsbA family oxidoreductase [Cellulomonas sp. PhB143]ROS79172.1 putative DsbA family dithiol-disulfide isomerase [Cellulomonas sp. PhB143]